MAAPLTPADYGVTHDPRTGFFTIHQPYGPAIEGITGGPGDIRDHILDAIDGADRDRDDAPDGCAIVTGEGW